MMGSKSPVDELVDGLDAIGAILDENLPLIKSRLDELTGRQAANANDINALRHSSKGIDESIAELKRTATNLDIRIEEILGTINALGRRIDQLQRSMLDMTLMVQELSIDSELADTVKMLEDRIKSITLTRTGGEDLSKRF
jgi:chromosome segregation ATPase